MEMLTLTKNSNNYVLSGINRSYSRSYFVAGTASRAIDGSLNYRIRALKTEHEISWSALTYDTAPDGGIGLAELEELMLAGGTYKLIVVRYDPSTEELFNVIFDPLSFPSDLVRLAGMKRRIWQVSIKLLEV